MRNEEQKSEPPKMCSKCGAAPRMPKRTICRKCHSRQSIEYQKRNGYQKEYRKEYQKSIRRAAGSDFARLESWCRLNNIKELAKQLAR